jgi:hypothetical protein
MPADFSSPDLVGLLVELDRGESQPALVDALGKIMREYAFQNARVDPAGRLKPSSEASGYLTTKCGKWTIFVPWALAFAFPGPDLTESLVELAERVKLDGRGYIALSGSATTCGRFVAIADVDFAQYIFELPEALSTKVRAMIERRTPAILVRVKFGESFLRPWDGLLKKLNDSLNNILPDRPIKFEFVDDATSYGLMAVSNFVLPSDQNDHMAGAAMKSYLFQEAILAEDGTPPWHLDTADELVRYVKYLIKAVKVLQTDSPYKALKRSLSLARVLRFDDLSVRAEALVGDETAAFFARTSSVSAIEDLWGDLNH